jgi:hypothetical protein
MRAAHLWLVLRELQACCAFPVLIAPSDQCWPLLYAGGR